MFAKTHVEMQHRIFCPLLFELFYGQALEQVLAPFEIAFESGDEQRFSETPRTVQKEELAVSMRHLMDVGRLVNIEVAFFADIGKRLYSYGISVRSHNCPYV